MAVQPFTGALGGALAGEPGDQGVQQYVAIGRFQAEQGTEDPLGEGRAELRAGDDQRLGEVVGEPDRAAFAWADAQSQVGQAPGVTSKP